MNQSNNTTRRRVAAFLFAGMLAFLVGAPESNAAEKVLFNFDGAKASEGWQAVNDNVMGGVSKGGARFPGDGTMLFAGVLSLENRGGFSSVRTNRKSMDLSAFDGLIARVRGDGRTYWMTVSTNVRIPAGSFKTTFKTVPGKWITVRAPFSGFRATSFGRELPAVIKVNPAKVQSIGFLIADKKAGPFRLEVDWIKAETKDNKSAAQKSAGAKSGPMDIVDTAVGAGKFKTLAAALNAAGLVETLKGEGPFTVFAPTDEAFAKLPKGTVQSLLKPENKQKLIAILKHHVVAGSVILANRPVKTLQGGDLRVVAAGQAMISQAKVITPDIKASNGVIHVIDKVLIPDFPEPTPAEKAMSVIQLAIERGVPLFNSRKPEACAAVYEITAQSLLSGHSETLNQSSRQRLQKALAEIKESSSPTSKAWTLRYALNYVYSSLQNSERN